ncbi:MAG: hypothetical protein E7501_03405 [Ruminococcus sp.]|nr:hypothetical protein [Ruminococcus sp.]
MNKYVDIHTHILPRTPLGPSDVETALEMLQALGTHGIKTAVATPLFDAACKSLDDFLQSRDDAFRALLPLIPPTAPNVVCGACVLLCPEVLKCRQLDRLRISETDFALVKIPDNAEISEELLSLLEHFRTASQLTPIICEADTLFAHTNIEDLLALQENGALLQISCGGILSQETRKLCLYLLGNHIAQFVSSGFRETAESPQLIEAIRVLKRSLPLEKYKRIKNNAGMLLSGAERSTLIGG